VWIAATALLACGQTTISIQDSEPKEPEEPEMELDPDRGLIAYLPLDETEPGSLALDLSGYGHDGTPSQNPPLPASSVAPVGFANPRSLAFNGVDQLLDLGDPPSLDIAGEITLSAWIRPLAFDAYRNVVAHGFRWMPNEEVSLRIHDGAFEFTTWNGMDHMVSAPIAEGDLDSWHHLAGVYAGGAYRLYRDGELIAEQAEPFGPTPVDAPWAVGGRSTPTPGEARFFSGLIDDVRIYERALSADEVRALFRR
jgi:hypothetical protein